jgi:hypothetical protein
VPNGKKLFPLDPLEKNWKEGKRREERKNQK